jgi:hypothetical protein
VSKESAFTFDRKMYEDWVQIESAKERKLLVALKGCKNNDRKTTLMEFQIGFSSGSE